MSLVLSGYVGHIVKYEPKERVGKRWPSQCRRMTMSCSSVG